MAFIITLLLLASEPLITYDNTKLRCHADSGCGKGECWEGQCEPSGYCMAYYTCV